MKYSVAIRKIFHAISALCCILVLILTIYIHGSFETTKDKLNILLRPPVLGLFFYYSIKAYKRCK